VSKEATVHRHFILLVPVSVASLISAFAQAPAQLPPAVRPAETDRFPSPPAVEKLQPTQHSIQINGKTIAYTATAGTLVLKKDDTKPIASIFFVAYTRDDAGDKSKRPVTFAFNGGPGSSSIWLHIGALGPPCADPVAERGRRGDCQSPAALRHPRRRQRPPMALGTRTGTLDHAGV
jgi:carboxypeptidase C (cathepsin A)